MSGQPGDVLSATHRHELETGSHILPDVIAERGYVTATGLDDLPGAFADYQRRSGLVIPIRDIMGDVIAFQLKADDPRLSKNGRSLKYDAATGGRQCLDVPTRSRIHLGNPSIPLWITEGAKKVDSGLSHGIRCIVGVNGTFGWRGKNDQGGTVALPDWESIALKGRDVVLAFDSDVTTKATVRGALDRLSAFLTQRGARVRYCLLPSLGDGRKCGLDDFFASGHGRDDLAPLIVDHLLKGVDDWEAPAFPDGVFPAAIDAYVSAGARSIGVPVEMVAVPLLVAAGSTIGNGVEIVLKRGYKQFPTLWAGIVAPPGTAKSPSFQVAQWPLQKLQQDAYNAWQQQRAAYDVDLDQWGAKPKAERGPKPDAPVLEHLYSTDPTIEALVSMMNGCRGLAILRDELSGMIGSFDKYRGGKGSDLQEYLQLWAGAPIKADRKGGGTTYAVHPVAGICGGIQPDILRGMHDSYGKRNGFIERFLLCVPDVQPQGWTDDDLDPALLDPVVDTFRRLHTFTTPHDAERISVNLSVEARNLWIAWYDDNTHAITMATGLRNGFTSKMPNQVARIALVLHCLKNADDPRPMISETTMGGAIAVVEFFRGHLDRVLPLIGDTSRGEPIGLPGRILRILRKTRTDRPDGWVSRTAIHDELRNVRAEVLTEELTRLFENDQVEKRTVPTATKPAEEWREKPRPPSGYSGNSGYLYGGGLEPGAGEIRTTQKPEAFPPESKGATS